MRAKLTITSGMQFVACGQSNQRPPFEAANQSNPLNRLGALKDACKTSAEDQGSASAQ